MHNSKPHHDARERANAFPSHRLAGMVFKARFGEHRSVHISDLDAIKKELQMHLVATLEDISHFIGDKEFPLIEEGDMPTMEFSTQLLHRLHIVGHHDEDKIIALMGCELMAAAVYPSPRIIPINGAYELAYDHDGDTLVIRHKPAPTIALAA